MKAKEFLSQAYKVDQSIDSKLEQIASLRELATKATSTISDMPGSGNRNIHKMEDAIVKLTDLENELHDDVEELIAIKKDVTHMIKRIGDRSVRIVMEKRYICFESWEQISVDLSYSIQHTYRLHEQGLHEIDQMLAEAD